MILLKLDITLDSLRLLGQSLTPLERLNAARRLGEGVGSAGEWITMALVAALIVMVVLLLRVTYNRIQQERRQAEQAFIENVRRRSLSVREYHLLQDIIKRSGLRNKNQIFQQEAAFEKGSALLLKESTEQQNEALHQRLVAEVSFLQEKLGFHDKIEPPESTSEARGKRKKLSTRDIPTGKTLHITRRLGRHIDEIEALILDNDDKALTISLAEPVKITFGELWRARYYFGASVWEFDTSVISYDGSRLLLRHSMDVRFVNRRRFVRVPVRNLAFVSRFPFARSLNDNAGLLAGLGGKESLDWKPLEFVHAVVTELAGPGIKLEAPIKVEPGDRILVIFRLDDKSEEAKGSQHRLIEDVGEVRRVKAIDHGYSIALEMVGLKDSDIDELVRVTNLNIFKNNPDQDIDDSDTAEAEETASKPEVLAQAHPEES